MDCKIIQQQQYWHFKNPFANKNNYIFFYYFILKQHVFRVIFYNISQSILGKIWTNS